MSKPMTATALMMLVDAGKVKLDDPVERYLPEFHGQMVIAKKTADRLVLRKPGHPITVREILSHTSGLVGQFAAGARARHVVASRRGYLLRVGAAPVRARQRLQYCNPGINTAGRLIEVVSGMPLRRIHAKAALRPSRHERHDLLAERRPVETTGKIVQRRPPAARASKRSRSLSSPIRCRTDKAALSGRRALFDRRGRRHLLPDDLERRRSSTARGFSPKSRCGR